MKTTIPFATISFNTPAFLKVKLEELQVAGIIAFWAFVEHFPEDDECGKKSHIHLYVEPAKSVQTEQFRIALREYDPDMPDKPKGCIACRKSKFADWYMYACHNKAYLAAKGQSRRYEYRYEAFQTSDSDDLLFQVRQIDMTHLTPYHAMQQAQDMGLTFAEFFGQGNVPVLQIALWEKAWNILMLNRTFRNGHDGHPMDIDPDTGELLGDALLDS